MRRAALVATLLLPAVLGACGGGGNNSSKPKVVRPVPVAGLSTNTGPAPWPRPDHWYQRARSAGFVPDVVEHLAYHVHAHLDVFVNGRAVTVPAGIGIGPPIRHQVVGGHDEYGFFGGPPCPRPCVSPLHTHDDSGVLHTESAARHGNTIGELFVEWGVRLDRSCVGGYCKPTTSIAVYVDGRRYRGDPRKVELPNFREVAIVIGRPPTRIPDGFPNG